MSDRKSYVSAAADFLEKAAKRPTGESAMRDALIGVGYAVLALLAVATPTPGAVPEGEDQKGEDERDPLQGRV